MADSEFHIIPQDIDEENLIYAIYNWNGVEVPTDLFQQGDPSLPECPIPSTFRTEQNESQDATLPSTDQNLHDEQPAAPHMKHMSNEDDSWSPPDDVDFLYSGEDEETLTFQDVSNEFEPESMVAVESNQPLFAAITPDLDMTSALSLLKELNDNGKRGLDSSFYSNNMPAYHPRSTGSIAATAPASQIMSIAEASEILPNPLRDELMKTYFLHVHPLCPIVDEFAWFEYYDNLVSEEELRKHNNLLMFQAIMFAALAHITDEQLATTKYPAVYDAQRALFEKINALYRRRFTSDHMILTKVSLLLTYWSPYDADFQVNSYWVDRAFYHARAIKLWDPQRYTGAMSCRRRIIWWMCLIRDRLISFGLRRPHRLQEAESDWAQIEESEFGAEVIFPRFVDTQTKKTTVRAFIWFCRLTDIMRTIAVFQENNRFEREWSDGHLDRQALISELTQVSIFDRQLKDWRRDYEKSLGSVLKDTTLRRSLIHSYSLIVCDSILTALYLPYIDCPPDSIELVERFQKVALRRTKAWSLSVFHHIRHIESTARIENVPSATIAWIALPLAVLKVLADSTDEASDGANLDRYNHFLSFLYALGVRFHAAQLVADMLHEATETIVERSKRLGLSRSTVTKNISSYQFMEPLEISKSSTDAKEGEILNCIAKMVELTMASDDTP